MFLDFWSFIGSVVGNTDKNFVQPTFLTVSLKRDYVINQIEAFEDESRDAHHAFTPFVPTSVCLSCHNSIFHLGIW